MIDKNKFQSFIRTLSDREIDSQLSDLFSFMEEYKKLLLEEQSVRSYSSASHTPIYNTPCFDDPIEEPDDSDEYIYNEDESEDDVDQISLDFNIIDSIHTKVADYSTEKLLDTMTELDKILSNPDPSISPFSLEISKVMRETCEIKYYEDFQTDPVSCHTCGAYLRPHQKFCGKCGTSVPENQPH